MKIGDAGHPDTVLRVEASSRTQSVGLLVAVMLASAACSSSAPRTQATDGWSSPRQAAEQYIRALGRGDLKSANAMGARDRSHCPSSGTHVTYPMASAGDRLTATVVRSGAVWRVLVQVHKGDGDSSSAASGSPVVVVRDANSFHVC